MATRFFIPFRTYSAPAYTLTIDYSSRKTVIRMATLNGFTTADELSAAIPLLDKNLPNVFSSECFNDAHLPFRKEAQSTEIGHLFEHMLLEYLCSTKLSIGYARVEFSGVTRWNWKKEPRGVFTIEVDCSYEDRVIFNEALRKTIALMNQIFAESEKISWNNHSYSSPSFTYAHN